MAALGLIGAAGFVLLLLHLLTGNRILPAIPALVTLARGNLVALLFGVSGGVGALVALLVTPQFRALNRISVFIAFFSIAAVVAAIDRGVGRLGEVAGSGDVRRRRCPRSLCVRRSATHSSRPGVSTRGYVRQRPCVRGAHRAPAAARRDGLSAAIHAVPGGARRSHREPLYSPMRMFVHSRDLRWSYGGMKGRPGDYLAPGAQPPVGSRPADQDQGDWFCRDRASIGRRCQTPVLPTNRRSPRSGPSTGSRARDRTLVFYRFPHTVAAADAWEPPLWVAGSGFYREEGDSGRSVELEQRRCRDVHPSSRRRESAQSS